VACVEDMRSDGAKLGLETPRLPLELVDRVRKSGQGGDLLCQHVCCSKLSVPEPALTVVSESSLERGFVFAPKKLSGTSWVARSEHERCPDRVQFGLDVLAWSDAGGFAHAQSERLETMVELPMSGDVDELPPVERPRLGSAPNDVTGLPFAGKPPERELRGLSELFLSPGEWRRFSGLGVEGLERGEHRWDAFHHKLRDELGPVEVFQAMLAEVDRNHPRPQTVLHKVTRRRGEKNLASVASCAYARDTVHGESNETLADGRGLSCMNRHTNSGRARPWPVMRSQRTLCLNSCGDSVLSSRERDKESVSLHVDDDAVVLLEPAPEKLPMIGQHLLVRLAEVLQQTRRASMSVNTSVTVPDGSLVISGDDTTKPPNRQGRAQIELMASTYVHKREIRHLKRGA
jgi:hypothetical protein